MLYYDLVVIGGGPAGMAAAIEARKKGIKDILILEREPYLGGILLQCIHNGFGLHYFGEELTGPEYAGRFEKQVKDLNIEVKVNTMVIEITANKELVAVNTTDGLMEIKSRAVVLAMGCRERTRGALNIPGTRPAGIFTAGTAQKFVNLEGYMPGRKVVILGSGDIGLIMARRMTLEGAQVKLVCEIMPYSGGLKRNIAQCLEDFDIPICYSHTITRVHGTERLEGVTVSAVDRNRKPILGSETYYECDTLLLSVGLIPENELSKHAGIEIHPITGGPVVDDHMQTSVEGIFACGNVVHVHDLVDYVTQEGLNAGAHVASYLNGKKRSGSRIAIHPGRGIRYCIPNFIERQHVQDEITIFFRSDDVYQKGYVVVYNEEKERMRKKKQWITPGEMQTLRFDRNLLGEAEGPITIALEQQEGG